MQSSVRLAGAVLAAAVLWSAAAGAQSPLSPEQQDAVKALIRDTLVNDPTLLKDAVQALQDREQRAEMDRSSAVIRDLGKALTHPEGLPDLLNAQGDVTVVEFSDYNCGYCKRVFPDLWQTLQADGKVRLVVLELPILGPESVTAARAALAAIPQNKYEVLHKALMEAKGKMTEESVLQIAKTQGLDVDKLKKDMKSPAVDLLLANSFQMAQSLGISGTPAFVIGSHLVPGALSPEALKEFIASARQK
ncbi:DsbA family protein [Pararhodospirillum photometricum]|uniref:DSBA oxidoreductase n=1 Tax=Pararhodospirillum photometricum DSM 122 TaxID=1150469 RepID=H6SKC6_PARPM|nr:DsbA family protein [Pararhodospirillum photometricum]CCG08441.1 DSBA oxidoreductase [Pararhodospirillum photometricum DSM 122]